MEGLLEEITRVGPSALYAAEEGQPDAAVRSEGGANSSADHTPSLPPEKRPPDDSYPSVLAYCTARNRQWIMPRWLETIAAQTVQPAAILVVLNDDPPEHGDFTLSVKSDPYASPPRYVFSLLPPTPGWERVAGLRGSPTRYDANWAGFLRNQAIRWMLDLAPERYDYLFGLDSDCLVEPDCLRKLLAASLDHREGELPFLTAPVVRANEASRYNYRTRSGWVNTHEIEPLRIRNPEERLRAEWAKVRELIEAEEAAGSILIPRSALEAGCRYEGSPTGEDTKFCATARQLGYRIRMVPTIRTEHWMLEEAPYVWEPCL